MRIYSMTATFGKLENETITFQPGLNVIHAPNEWGKSTWCAFLVSMLYGIETRVHTTKTAIADKERYAPWSGAPMAGRIDLNWNGRDITIERSSKGRSVFGVFRAYETDTGLEVTELTAANCGQMLLGVEKSVFLRAGFLKLTDLPVTQDESLRRRLNAIVTTGDESGTADALGQKLKDLKNRCRLNRSTGLLPQAETQQKDLQSKLAEHQQLQEQSARIHQRLEELDAHHKALLNHKAALQYAANETYHQKLAAAEAALAAAQAKEADLRSVCQDLPQADQIEHKLQKLRQLRDSRDSLHIEAQMLPAEPQAPQVDAVFRGVEPHIAISRAEEAYASYLENSKKKPFPWYCILLFVLGAVALLIPHWAGKVSAAIPVAAGLLILRKHTADARQKEEALKALIYQYPSIAPENWVNAANSYADAQVAYEEVLKKYRASREALDTRISQLRSETDNLTGGQSLVECEQYYTAAREKVAALADAQRETHRAAELVGALGSSHTETPKPEVPDHMTYTEAETARLISDCTYEQRHLQLQLGHCRGRMESLGQESVLRRQLDEVTERIRNLEQTYAALEIAQNTLTAASNELQRRFAPRISQRAQELFGKLTGGHYTRLTLGEDLSVNAATGEETTLHSALWRSEGTIDQLYLALRLAVAEELTPEAPLVLDDALVRFDDQRLKEALDVLTEASEAKQVILFSCQQRENQLTQQ